MRVFVTDTPDGWSELTDGGRPPVRVSATDLQQARRVRARIRETADDVAVILDVTVAVAADFRSVRDALDPVDGVRYGGTVDGLAGLISDIELADVADGVTLLPASPRQDVRAVGRDVLDRLAARAQPRAS
ncbi:hypothetical protein H7J88_14340 [Mycolicibacterium flavescens]|uniref:Uncharacterized protein n=1 Tax=Mycolicibacterium flavescens TaxID=1776 RepID=A0A1E3REN0_MYCFV|nr:hypothetical protein [Mycolicibacterium flavescens]MCV7280825.1 hypothetical protein [Mycolicibacterium flavescens]ODQ88328.1 hypothetical protein BHQ18_19470 [Mycolicibacterium flavescens]